MEIDLSNPRASGGGEGESLVGRNKADRAPIRRARKAATPGVAVGAAAANVQAQGSFQPGPSPMVEGADEPAVPAVSARTSAAPSDVRALAKPPVRKLAKDLGVDLSTLTPSGTGRHRHSRGRGVGCLGDGAAASLVEDRRAAPVSKPARSARPASRSRACAR